MKKLNCLVCLLMVLVAAVPLYCDGSAKAEAEKGSEILTNDQLRVLVSKIGDELKNKYVYPHLGEKMAQKILDKLAKNRYSTQLNSQELAAQIEKDLYAIARDKHLHLVIASSLHPTQEKNSTPQNNGPKNDNFGFNKVEVLPGNIGYLRIDRMAIEREAARVASDHLNKLSKVRAIIFDLRGNPGGAAGMVVYLSSYLFKEEKHLYSMYNRLQNRTKDVRTLTGLPGKKQIEDKPVYILTSAKTFSAAEGFAYTLKHHKRAVIVGERTGGGAHPMIWSKLPYNFMLCIPFARIIHPVTNTDWEGKGVIPHHEVSSEEALQKAIYLINNQKKSFYH